MLSSESARYYVHALIFFLPQQENPPLKSTISTSNIYINSFNHGLTTFVSITTHIIENDFANIPLAMHLIAEVST